VESSSACDGLLGTGDPAPVDVLHRDGRSAFVLTCEHAGRRLPARLDNLGLGADQLERHIAWDIGAASVARRLAMALDAPCVLQTYSRLVIDCNRWPQAEDFVTAFSEDTTIPGNMGLSTADIASRTREIYQPYHDAIRAILDEREAEDRATVLIAVHSCTPVYLGVHRPWHIGVLYERDRRFADVLFELLGAEEGLIVGDNEPYYLTDEKDYSVPVHGERRGLPHVEFEIRQDLIADEAGQARWAARLHRLLDQALMRLRERGMV